jgi:hypothetical protein
MVRATLWSGGRQPAFDVPGKAGRPFSFRMRGPLIRLRPPTTRVHLGPGSPAVGPRLRERPRNHLAEEREVAVGFRVRSVVDDDLGGDEVAGLQVERVRERDDADVA